MGQGAKPTHIHTSVESVRDCTWLFLEMDNAKAHLRTWPPGIDDDSLVGHPKSGFLLAG